MKISGLLLKGLLFYDGEQFSQAARVPRRSAPGAWCFTRNTHELMTGPWPLPGGCTHSGVCCLGQHCPLQTHSPCQRLLKGYIISLACPACPLYMWTATSGHHLRRMELRSHFLAWILHLLQPAVAGGESGRTGCGQKPGFGLHPVSRAGSSREPANFEL